MKVILPNSVVRKTLQVLLILCGISLSIWAQSRGDSKRFDGPAELPRVYVQTRLSQTPAPGKSIAVKNAAEFTAAIEKAACGDTIQLQAGAEFAGTFKFPAKTCDDQNWIILRTSAADRDLPPEGSRINPCYAGVPALPGRPRYSCDSATNVMAKIVSKAKGTGPIVFGPGANHYRFIGLEITRDSSGSTVHNLVLIPHDAAVHHLIFDRVWVHGTAQDETTRGVALGASQYVAVVDSYLNDFHCIAGTGACVDSQAIQGGLGDLEMGPYKIVNNYLEGAAENILFGGGPATTAPADIEIRHNHLFKPTNWRQGADGFVGGASGKPFIVKNLFELKNAQRVLLEGNILENSWGGFTQTGFAILLTPKNQANRCPLCKVTDVVIRYNQISHIASGMQMGTGLSDAGGAASGGARYSIHDNVFDDIGGKAYGGFGAFAQISSTQPSLRDVHITNNTAFPPRALFILGVEVEREKISNFLFTDNLIGIGDDEIVPTGGGPKNCAFQPRAQGLAGVLKKCFVDANVTRNVIIGSSGGWPEGNLYIRDPNSLLEDFKTGKGGNYRICRVGQPHCKRPEALRRAAKEGKEPGADIDAVQSATKGAN